MTKRTIGVCFSGTGEEYQLKIINALMEYISGFDIRLLLFACLDNKYSGRHHDEGEYSVFKLINFGKLDGLIILSESIKDIGVLSDLIRAANENKVPVVCFDKPVDGADCNVIFDDCGAVESITEHLIKVHGCRKINFLAGYSGQLVSDRRLTSYKAALEKNNIPFEPERVADGGWWAFPTKQAVDKWLEDGMVFDAIVCANDNMAMAAADELYVHGLRVPEDVRVTGIDDLCAAQCFIPRMTSARFKHSEGIAAAVDFLRDTWAGKPTQSEIVLGNELIFAASCGCSSDELDRGRINGNAFDLAYQHELINVFDKHMIRFTNNVTSAESFEGSLEILANYCKRSWCREMWICVNHGFFDDAVLSNSFSDLMELVIYKDPYTAMIRNDTFPKSDILPDFEKCIEDNKNILIIPLHISDKVIGFVAREIMSTAALDMWYTFSMNLSTMFSVIRSQRHLRLANEQLENLYIHDPMTGAFNRRGFFKEMSKRFAGREDAEIMVVSADLDGLKEINDKYGHTEGDKAIETVAAALMTACGDKCVCARFGGDEFIAAGEYEAGLAEEFETRFNQCIFNHNSALKSPYEIAASIGIVSDRCTFDKIDKIISLADERMYLRKNERKQCIRQTPR